MQAKLTGILGHNEATARLVLHTGQADLARTTELLARTPAGELPPVADVMAAAAGNAADVGPTRLRAALEAKIKSSFDHWDRAARRPERDSRGREKDVTTPWVKNVGTVLAAWYAWQKKAGELTTLQEQERALDVVSAELAALEAEMAADRGFLDRSAPLRDGLGRRSVISETIQRLRDAGRTLAETLAQWPQAAAARDAARNASERIRAERQRLDTERQQALRRGQAAGLQAAFQALVAARDEWQAAEAAVARSFRPADEAVRELELLGDRIKDARNRIEARKLAYRIALAEPMRVRVQEGVAPPQDVTSPGDVTGDVTGVAAARLEVQAGPVTVTVTSGTEDVVPLFTALEQDVAREAGLLAACRGDSLADAKALVRQHDALVAAATTRRTVYETRLQGRSFEAWQEEIAGLDQLPQTRSVTVIDAELGELQTREQAATREDAVNDGNLREWIRKYGDQDSLLNVVVQNRMQLQAVETELATLPTVPEGYASADAFLTVLTQREAAYRERPTRLRDLATRQQQLKDAIGDRTTGELAEVAAALERDFARALREGEAYERILAALDEVEQEPAVDWLDIFAGRVTERFRAVTGGDERLAFDAQLPARVIRGRVELPNDLLSQGTGTALALVLRLSLAEVHLGGRPGFIVLDDPLVDIDTGRRERAKELLRRFAATHQVIFLTCHESHAEGLGSVTSLGDEQPA